MKPIFQIIPIEVLLASILALSPFSVLRMSAAPSGDISLLMLGDNLNRSGHAPQKKAEILIPAMAARGIAVTYTNELRALNPQTLAAYDCLLLYNNIDELPPAEEKALLGFVETGKGLVVVHCASYAFRNSEKYVALVGAQFASHSNETFRAQIIDAQHPAMRGLKSFEATDESYVHTKSGNDRRVLMVRERQGGYEPWTWVRQQGQGRVFYTASGHSEEVSRHPDFQKLIEQGVRWSAGRLQDDKPALSYVQARVPRYVNNAAWGTSEEQTTMQAPLPPADSMKHIHLPEGFRVELFASEPQIIKPISMNFDERGRLWVIESIDYPNDLVPDPHLNGHDRIKICEDTDGDGRADKFTLFADKLNCPTSLVFARGGIIVTVAPHILFLKDTNGDGVADVRQILYTGLGRADTHAVASNLHYGPDNWIYGSVGYSGGKVQVGNSTQTFRMGLFRFRADGSAFEVLTTTSNNTWGFGFDESGDIFGSTANNEHAIHLAIPNRYFEAVHGWHGQGSMNIGDHKQFHPVTDDVRQVDVYGGYTAASGFEVYTARSFPESFWDRTAFVCEPTGHLVHLDKLVRQGSEFIAHDGYNLLASSDAWTAPIAAQVGPDGAVWVIDWYNYIVQHNPTPQGFTNGPGNAYSTALRDKEHGRVYRVVSELAQPAPKANLERATPQQLVETLANDNLFWRLTAQRLLVDRGQTDVAPALAELVTQGSNPQAALHALRTLDGLGWLAGAEAKVSEVLWAGLASSSPRVRRAALAVLPRQGESVGRILKSALLQDPDAFVRKDALLTLAEMPGSPEAGEAIAAMLNEPRNARDRWIPLAAISAAARNDLAFLKAVARIKPDEQLLKTLAQAASIYAEHYARGGPTDSLGSLISTLRGAHPQIAGAVIAGLATGWPMAAKPVVTLGMEEDLRALMERLPLQAHLQVASVANRWGSGDKFQVDLNKIKESLLMKLSDSQASEEERAATARQLVSFGSDQATIGRVLDQVTPQTSLELARGLLDAFGQSSSPEIATAFADRWRRFTPAVRAHVLSLLLQRPDWTKTLLDAIGEGKIPATDLNVQQSQALLQNANPSLSQRAQTLLSRGGRLPNADRQKMLDSLLPLAKRRGDINQGRLVFEKNCATCHRFAGMGTVIGPDLTGIAAGNREEILLNILDPNRSVEANFRQFQIETKDGRSLSGLIVAETKAALELLEAQGQRQVLQRSDLAEIRSSELSLMPEGFETLPADELVSLLDYLTERSGFFPLSLRKVANAITTKGMFGSSDGTDRLVFENWEPKAVFGAPFHLIDPRGDTVPNAVVLHGPHTAATREGPKSVSVPCNAAVKGIHLLSGVSGWGYPTIPSGSVSMIVRLHYADGASEDHALTNGIHFADFIRRVDVPESRFAFTLQGGQQLRSLKIYPARWAAIDAIEFIKGPDDSVPVIMAVTAEGLDAGSRVDGEYNVTVDREKRPQIRFDNDGIDCLPQAPDSL